MKKSPQDLTSIRFWPLTSTVLLLTLPATLKLLCMRRKNREFVIRQLGEKLPRDGNPAMSYCFLVSRRMIYFPLSEVTNAQA